jgi:superfamily I DNA/RNA helicase
LNDDDSAITNCVSLGTMHRAKGLEFKAVAVVGCDADLLPLRSVINGLLDSNDKSTFLEQERNLFYVALTRAREQLLLTHTKHSSPFLAKLISTS